MSLISFRGIGGLLIVVAQFMPVFAGSERSYRHDRGSAYSDDIVGYAEAGVGVAGAKFTGGQENATKGASAMVAIAGSGVIRYAKCNGVALGMGFCALYGQSSSKFMLPAAGVNAETTPRVAANANKMFAIASDLRVGVSGCYGCSGNARNSDESCVHGRAYFLGGVDHIKIGAKTAAESAPYDHGGVAIADARFEALLPKVGFAVEAEVPKESGVSGRVGASMAVNVMSSSVKIYAGASGTAATAAKNQPAAVAVSSLAIRPNVSVDLSGVYKASKGFAGGLFGQVCFSVFKGKGDVGLKGADDTKALEVPNLLYGMVGVCCSFDFMADQQ